MNIMIENSPLETLTGLVIFEIAGREFCADIKEIAAIINPEELEDKIKTHSGNKFIIINNTKVPIVNLHECFGLMNEKKKADARILLIETKNKMFGFYVERVKEILTTSKDFSEKLRFIPSKGSKFMNGTLDYEGRRLFYPDFYNIFTSY